MLKKREYLTLFILKLYKFGMIDMKRIICFCLSLILLLSFCGCNKKSEKTVQNHEDRLVEYPNYKSIEGTYTDKNNKNKTAKISESKDGKYCEITVKEKISDIKRNVWSMTAVYKDSKLIYSDGHYSEYSEEYGNELISQGACGYFVLNDDKTVSWSGAEDKKNKKCLFVRDEDE